METLLAADIGGTQSRFALFQADPGGFLRLRKSLILDTGQARSFGHLLQQLFRKDPEFSPDAWEGAVFAVPGPVEDQRRAHLANIPWAVDITPLESRCQVCLINDIAAQAFACRHRGGSGAAIVQPGLERRSEVVAVIGAGTGLGCGAVATDREGRPVAVPSEAGHTVFPLHGPEEEGYRRFLCRFLSVDDPTGDDVVSGPGLSRLHQYLTGEKMNPAAVARQLTPEAPTLRWFACFYGRAARHYALAVLPLGGLYVSGGVAIKNPMLVQNETFLEAFCDSTQKGPLLRSIPVRLITDENIGLWGAALYGLDGGIRPEAGP